MRLLLALAVGAIAAWQFSKPRRTTTAGTDNPFPTRQPPMGGPQEGSLNPAEQLQQTQAQGAYAGVGTPGQQEPRVFPEAERREGMEGEEKIEPGLPDYARGA